jgi:type 1 glutamine amidotransferase
MKIIFLLSIILPALAITPDGKHKLVLIAGKPSHGQGYHEFRAGTMLLEKCLANTPNLVIDRHEMDWVKDENTFEDADAIVVYSDGRASHPFCAPEKLDLLKRLTAKGVSFACMHYAVEVEDFATHGTTFQSLIGGYYEREFSCNPIWSPEFKNFPTHPITRGITPFQIEDEWYINMRFNPKFKDGISSSSDETIQFTPILIATPPDATRDGPYVAPKGPYPHIQAEKGQPECTLWCVERKDGGRGFGFTGGHFHRNWGNDSFRKIILNAITWLCKLEVPENGIQSTVTPEELTQNLDDKPAPKVKSLKKKVEEVRSQDPTPTTKP